MVQAAGFLLLIAVVFVVGGYGGKLLYFEWRNSWHGNLWDRLVVRPSWWRPDWRFFVCGALAVLLLLVLIVMVNAVISAVADAARRLVFFACCVDLRRSVFGTETASKPGGSEMATRTAGGEPVPRVPRILYDDGDGDGGGDDDNRAGTELLMLLRHVVMQSGRRTGLETGQRLQLEEIGGDDDDDDGSV